MAYDDDAACAASSQSARSRLHLCWFLLLGNDKVRERQCFRRASSEADLVDGLSFEQSWSCFVFSILKYRGARVASRYRHVEEHQQNLGSAEVVYQYSISVATF